jgi:hypothetical protein
MRKVVFILILLLLVGGIGAGFLATWNMPAPSEPKEKIISNDRLGE